jgi:fructuronate reductase
LRLSRASVDQLPAYIERPRYSIGATPRYQIVHLGIGAFHRAHQAVYTNDANNAGNELWGITGVSLRSPDVAAQLNPQDGLYIATLRSSGDVRQRLIGAVRRVLVAPALPQAVVDAIADPRTEIVSFTVTEKGYCRAGGGKLDLQLADDNSLYRYLRDGLRQRCNTGYGGLTLLSCDNLSGNGAQLESLFAQYLEATAPELLPWFREHCTCPSTMVDRIVPASTLADLDRLEDQLGMRDDGAVFTEPFTQWVIEDRFAGPRPRWEIGGAQFTRNVHAYETAKLRMLNGAHSALAYLGLARGHTYVHQAITDLPLRALVERLMREEAATSFMPEKDQNLRQYADALLHRFANTALNHRLIQIAMDGSQKIPQRWLETLTVHQAQSRTCPAILTALAAWIAFVRGDQWKVDDPRAVELAALWQQGNASSVIDALFGPQGLFSATWVARDADRAALLTHLENPAAL